MTAAVRLLVLLILILGAGALAAAAGLLGQQGSVMWTAARPPVPAANVSTPAAAPNSAPAADRTRPPAGGATLAPSGPAGTSGAGSGGAAIVPRGAGSAALVLDESTLSSQATTALAGQALGDTPLGPATLRQVAVQLRDGRITANGTAQVGPAAVPVTAAGVAEAVSGRVRVTVSSASVAGIPLPAASRSQIEAQLQSQVDGLLAAEPVRVTSVTVADGRLTVVGTRG